MPALGPALDTEATGFLPMGPDRPVDALLVLVRPLVAGDLSVTGISAQAVVLTTTSPMRGTHPCDAIDSREAGIAATAECQDRRGGIFGAGFVLARSS
jgi:hypothetical protein